MAFDPLANIRPKSGISQIFKYEFLNPNLWSFWINDNPDIQFLVKSVSLPFIKFETETRNQGSKVLKSVTPEESFSITFNETADLDVYNFMSEWMDNIFDKNNRKFRIHTYKSPKSYVKTANLTTFKYNKLNIFTPATTEEVKGWKFSNLMITGIDNMDWDYEGTSNKTITCQFTVDSVDEFKVGGHR